MWYIRLIYQPSPHPAPRRAACYTQPPCSTTQRCGAEHGSLGVRQERPGSSRHEAPTRDEGEQRQSDSPWPCSIRPTHPYCMTALHVLSLLVLSASSGHAREYAYTVRCRCNISSFFVLLHRVGRTDPPRPKKQNYGIIHTLSLRITPYVYVLTARLLPYLF